MKILGYVIFGLSGLAMFGFQLYWFHRWWGDVGVLAGLFIPLLVAAFPFLYYHFKRSMSLMSVFKKGNKLATNTPRQQKNQDEV
jgi:hypothetical protein